MLVAFLPKSWGCEIRFRDCPGKPCLVVCRLLIAGGIGIVEVIAVSVIIAAPGSIPYRRIRGGRTGRCIGCGVLAHRRVGVGVCRRQGIARLEDAGAANTPASGYGADSSLPIVQPFQRIVEAEREAIRRVKDRRRIVLRGVVGRGIRQSVILRTRTGVRGIDKAARHSALHVKVHTVVVSITVILCIKDRSEARIEAGWREALMCNEVAWQHVNIHTVGDTTDGVSVADNVVGVGPVISNGRSEDSGDSSLHADRPDIGLWRLHKRIDSSDREVCPDYTAVRVQPPLECWECKPKRRRICGAQREDGRSRRSRIEVRLH